MKMTRLLIVGLAVTLVLLLGCSGKSGNDANDSGNDGVVDPQAASDLADIQYDQYLEDRAQEQAISDAYDRGQQDGYDEGYDEGYQLGYEEGLTDGCESLGRKLQLEGILDWYRC
jgi:flagellar biosynthesis/type III secretory pathway protein FliH